MPLVYMIDSNTNEYIWIMSIDEDEIIVGILAGSVPILEEINSKKNNNYLIDTDIDVSEYRVLNEIPEDKVMDNTCGYIEGTNYGIWLRSYRSYHYSLYKYETPFFFQGLISICNYFEVDFRNYLLGMPFGADGKKYALNGYVMTGNMIAQDAPDLDDVDEEIIDDENYIEPLRKDY